ncbi:hypothetical protein [Streptoalloteichus hindustanus]|uniref:TrbL/VirB6 plasmid conjugal transfer protein n=1 Tax=Streptoalloteichus hindustanus TaxID=2017 RepID=A0A1M5M8N0_STRHI|nr:hypothetical protein [Streptoalloteichus hindustanus]SHG73612.1 hypothetical protein SAMN05444320_11331 [Streptoalloteichus hindustanus]
MPDWIKDIARDAFDTAMRAIWDCGLEFLRVAFELADAFPITVSTSQGPIGTIWPLTLYLSGLVALGLFFAHLISVMLRGGRGALRLVTGPVQYGLALAVVGGSAGLFLAAADGLATGILRATLKVNNFGDALRATSLTDGAKDSIKAVTLGLGALFGIIPAALGYLLEMLFRAAAILILVGCTPLAAAGLLSGVTAHWFWVTVRWLLAAICMKPVLALSISLGVLATGGAQGLAEVLVSCGLLLVSLYSPVVLFRLFSFVDPNTGAGQALREAFAAAGGRHPYDTGMDRVGLTGGDEESDERAHEERFAPAEDDHEDTDDTDRADRWGRFAEDGDDDHARRAEEDLDAARAQRDDQDDEDRVAQQQDAEQAADEGQPPPTDAPDSDAQATPARDEAPPPPEPVPEPEPPPTAEPLPSPPAPDAAATGEAGSTAREP